MPLRSWVGSEPVEVQLTDPTQIESTLTRYSTDPEFNTVAWLGPGINQTWEIESLQIESQHSGVAGQRDFYLYVMDRDGKMLRHLCTWGIAVKLLFHIAGPDLAFTEPIDNGAVVSNTGPCYVHRLDYPCKLGVLWTRFGDAADVVHFSAMVRERMLL